MPFLDFFGFGEVLARVLEADKGPEQAAVLVDGLASGCYGGKSCCSAEVADRRLNAGESIDIITHLHCCWPVVAACHYVRRHRLAGGEEIH